MKIRTKLKKIALGALGACFFALLAPLTSVAANGIAEDNSRFATELYQRMQNAQPGKNVFYSPLSISTALAMTYAGSRGETESQIAAALHFRATQDELHQNYAELLASLKGGEGYTLNMANALWGQSGYGFREEFVSLADSRYQGGFRQLDFSGDTENSRLTINRWAEENTSGKIKELLRQGDINFLTRLVLTNAIYFKGDWETSFDVKMTRPQPFKRADGSMVEAAMMRQSESFAYLENEELQALELPYKGKDIAMLLLLPKQGDLNDFAATLAPGKIKELRAAMRLRQVDVELPKFKFAARYYLDNPDLLPALGMRDAFDKSRADFSGLNGRKDLCISHVIHQAVIEVNEQGSEAAAATAVVVGLKSMPLRPASFKADHPFVFLLLHKPSDSILFLGSLNDPSAK